MQKIDISDGKRREVTVIFRTTIAISEAGDDEDAESAALQAVGAQLIEALDKERYDLFTVTSIVTRVDGASRFTSMPQDEVDRAASRGDLISGHVVVPMKEIMELEAVRDLVAMRFAGTYLNALSLHVVETTDDGVIIEVTGKP